MLQTVTIPIDSKSGKQHIFKQKDKGNTMKAIAYTQCGSPKELALVEKVKPTPKANEVLIKVRATSLNGSDLEMLSGKPYYGKITGKFNPAKGVLGSDVAGEVVALGKDVTYFQIGDPVFGDLMEQWGGLAEYAVAREDKLMLIPPSLSFEEAASLPQSAVIALQAMRDHGKVEPGQKVLINGAGGSAGLYAIQMAKFFGAEVTAVDNQYKESAMREAGADTIINFEEMDCVTLNDSFDFILDFISYRSIFDYKKILNSNGKYAVVGGSMRSMFQGLVSGPIQSLFGSKKLGLFFHNPNTEDLFAVTELIGAGVLQPQIHKVYNLDDTQQAFTEMYEGRSAGKVVLKVA